METDVLLGIRFLFCRMVQSCSFAELSLNIFLMMFKSLCVGYDVLVTACWLVGWWFIYPPFKGGRGGFKI